MLKAIPKYTIKLKTDPSRLFMCLPPRNLQNMGGELDHVAQNYVSDIPLWQQNRLPQGIDSQER